MCADRVPIRCRGKRRAQRLEALLDLILAKFRPEIGAVHGVERAIDVTRPAKVQMVGGKCRADRAASITRSRLDEDALEVAVAQNLAVCDAVERNAASKA